MESKYDELNDRDWLRSRIEDGLDYDDIADELGCSSVTVVDWLCYHDIDQPSHWRTRTESEVDVLNDVTRLRDLRRDGHSAETISDMLDVPPGSVRRWLIRHGIDIDHDDPLDENDESEPTEMPPWARTGQPWQDAEQLRRAYWGYYWSTREIAEWCGDGVKASVIRNEMQRKDIPTRGPTEGKKVHRMKERGESLDVIRNMFPEPTSGEQSDEETARERSLRKQRDDGETTVEWSRLAAGDD